MGSQWTRRSATMAGASVLSALLIPAGAASATPSFTSGSWGTQGGGAVEVKADGSYDMAFTDETTQQAVFSNGRLVSKKPNADGKLELTLKPAAKGPVEYYVIVLEDSGNGVLLAVENGQRHKAAELTK
jgi:hypothetical protein